MATKRLTDTGIANLNPPAAGRLEIWDAIVPGLGLRVGARRKTFVVMARAEGRLRRVSLGVFPGMGVAKARRKAREIIEQAQNGIDPVEARREAKVAKTQQRANTISATVEEYIERYAKPRQRSWLQTKRRLEIYLVDELGDTPVSSLTRADIVRVLDSVLEKGFATGANRTLANIKTYLRWCAERGLIERSPADLLRPPSPEVSRDRVLTDKELAAVWHASLSAGYPYGDIVRLLVLTGQRREEVGGMGWDELSLNGKAWTIGSDRNKGGRLHVVPLTRPALAILRDIEQVGPLVFPSRADVMGETSFSGWSKAKRRLDKSSGVTNWRLHDLRRTAATGMARLGAAPFVVERVLNHATSAAGPLAAVYQRYDYAKEKEEALRLWSDEVLRVVSTEAVAGHSSTAAE